jgi:predicted transcriptional regulator
VQHPPLGPLERRVMEQLWRSGPSTVGEVLDALNAASPDALAYTTVMTTLTRLHEKGYLTRAKEGRGFRYAAAVDEASLAGMAGRRELQRLIERHGASAVAAFAADLSEANGDLVARLRDLARHTEESPK